MNSKEDVHQSRRNNLTPILLFCSQQVQNKEGVKRKERIYPLIQAVDDKRVYHDRRDSYNCNFQHLLRPLRNLFSAMICFPKFL